ncbi:nuclease-related domain-containing protein [Pseudalkalibacillus sp. R45]|uniref:nuclease-related domain-containing protein n=1 Tax=Pseudalkalibacillus sp. R45 TaxID=3457433 RepID=UPI003FCD8518
MDTLIFLGVILVLMCMIFGLLVFIKKKHVDYDEMIEEFQTEAVASLTKVENDLLQEKDKVADKIKESYERKIKEYKKYVHTVEKLSRTTSEANTHNILTEIKKELVADYAIKSAQMKILSNVFLPNKTASGEIYPVKIDHIVIMRTGVYIIDTNEFTGDVLYGVTKGKAKELSLILDHLFPTEEVKSEKTIVLRKERDNINGLNVTPVDDPKKHVMTGAAALNHLLENQLGQFSTIPILYFDHHENNFVNYSHSKTPFVFDDKPKLYQFFLKQLKEGNKVHSEFELEKIRNVIESLSIDY